MKYLGQFSNDNDIVKKSDINSKMDKVDPTGTGSFSLNRAANTTIGSYSFVEGRYNEASGDYSHAEGAFTESSGSCSHAEGNFSHATGDNSHAEGVGTIARSKSQHVFGEHNVIDLSGTSSTRGTYIEIVGNGTLESLSNARTLDWNGNEVLSGNITLKGGKIGDGNNSTYKLALPNTTGWTADKTIATTDDLATKMEYLTSVALTTAVQTYGMGRIEFEISSSQKLVYQYGCAWVNDGVTFDVPYNTILFANSTTQHNQDAQTQRAALKTVSTTGLTFYGGSNQLCRWEAWGLVTIS